MSRNHERGGAGTRIHQRDAARLAGAWYFGARMNHERIALVDGLSHELWQSKYINLSTQSIRVKLAGYTYD